MGRMRAAWGFAIVVAICSFLTATVSGILSYTRGGAISRTIFIAMCVLAGLSFLSGLIAMGLASAANAMAGEILKQFSFNNADFEYSVGWCELVAFHHHPRQGALQSPFCAGFSSRSLCASVERLLSAQLHSSSCCTAWAALHLQALPAACLLQQGTGPKQTHWTR